MNQITITEFKKLKVPELKEVLPCEITSDGQVIGVLGEPEADMSQVKTKCPNCKMVYNVEKPDGLPSFFSVNP